MIFQTFICGSLSRKTTPQTNRPAMMSGPNRFTMLLIVSSSFFVTASRLGLFQADRGDGYRKQKRQRKNRNDIARAPDRRGAEFKRYRMFALRRINNDVFNRAFFYFSQSAVNDRRPAREIGSSKLQLIGFWRLDSEPAQFRRPIFNRNASITRGQLRTIHRRRFARRASRQRGVVVMFRIRLERLSAPHRPGHIPRARRQRGDQNHQRRDERRQVRSTAFRRGVRSIAFRRKGLMVYPLPPEGGTTNLKARAGEQRHRKTR